MQLANPLFRLSVDIAATYDYFWSHGMISDLVYEDIVRSCDFEGYQMTWDLAGGNVSEACRNYIAEANNTVGAYVSQFDVIRDVCNTSFAQQELILGRKVWNFDSCSGAICMILQLEEFLLQP